MAALGSLILGGSKAEAALAGVGQAIAVKLLGPMGKFVGVAFAATKGIFSMTKAFASMGTTAAAKLETVQNQLRVMLKGLDAAKQRVRELRNFSIATPFKMGDIIAGSRAMESLSKGALSTTANMTMVGDAAAQAGVNFEDMAVYVGRLYDGLAGGRPVGEVLFRLAELGVISGTARTSLEKLQESGAGFSEVWRVVQSELGRSRGTMEYTSKTFDALQDTLADTEESLKATFSGNFLDGQKEALEAQIKTLKNLEPAVAGIGSALGGWVSVMNTLGAKLTAFATGLPGVAKGLEFLARMAGIASGGLLLLATASGITKAASMLAGLAGVATRTGQALMWFGGRAAWVSKMLGLLVTGPMAAVTVGLMAGYALWTQHAAAVEAAASALREYRGATDAMLAKMKAQRDAMKSLDDLAAGYADTLGQLAQAYRDEAQAASDAQNAGWFGQEEAAAIKRQTAAIERQIKLKDELAKKDALSRDALEKNAFYAENQAARQGNRRAESQAELDAARQTMSPLAREASFRKEAERLGNERAAAVRENMAIQSFEGQKQGIGERLIKNKTAQGEAEKRMASFDNYNEAFAVLQKLKDEEQALLAQELKMAEAQSSAIVKLQAKLSLYAKYQAAVQAANEAEVKLREAENEKTNSNEGVDAKTKSIKSAKAALFEAEATRTMMEQVAGAAGITPAKVQEMNAEITRLKGELQAALVNKPQQTAASAQAAQEKRARARANAESGQDLRAQRAEETKGALSAAQVQLSIEKQRLDLQKQYGEIDGEVYRNRKAALESEQRLLAQRKAMAAAENTAGVQAGQKNLEAKAARLRGRGAEARRLEEEAARLQEDAGKEARIREIMDRTGMDRAAAEKQAGGEIGRERLGRGLDREGGLLSALLGRGQVVDSMQRIGGGGGVSAAPDVKKVIDRLDKLIQAVKEQRTGVGEQRLY